MSTRLVARLSPEWYAQCAASAPPPSTIIEYKEGGGRAVATALEHAGGVNKLCGRRRDGGDVPDLHAPTKFRVC